MVSGEGYGVSGLIRLEAGEGALPDLTPLLQAIVLCNDSHIGVGQVIGDPMEGALLVLAAKGGIKPTDFEGKLPRIAEIPFDSSHKFMATFHRDESVVRIFLKGAPEVLLERCTLSWGIEEVKPLTDQNIDKTSFRNLRDSRGVACADFWLLSATLALNEFQLNENPFHLPTQSHLCGIGRTNGSTSPRGEGSHCSLPTGGHYGQDDYWRS